MVSVFWTSAAIAVCAFRLLVLVNLWLTARFVVLGGAAVLTRFVRLIAVSRLLEAVVIFAEERRRGAFRFAPELAFFRFATTRFMTDTG